MSDFGVYTSIGCSRDAREHRCPADSSILGVFKDPTHVYE